MSVSRPARSEALATPLTGMRLDRAMTLRSDPVWVAQQLGEPTTRAVAAGRDGVLLGDGLAPALMRQSLSSPQLAT